jgi:hypothetical protein
VFGCGGETGTVRGIPGLAFSPFALESKQNRLWRSSEMCGNDVFEFVLIFCCRIVFFLFPRISTSFNAMSQSQVRLYSHAEFVAMLSQPPLPRPVPELDPVKRLEQDGIALQNAKGKAAR